MKAEEACEPMRACEKKCQGWLCMGVNTGDRRRVNLSQSAERTTVSKDRNV